MTNIIDLGLRADKLCWNTYANRDQGNLDAARTAIRNSLNAPASLCAVRGLQYDNKIGGYTATFTGMPAPLTGRRPLPEDAIGATLRVTNDVADFIAHNLRVRGTWVGRMDGGVLVDVYLLIN